jgi:DMSO/TMAO reductase YedYZ molybdopterin-dependent catalytic subunit
VYLNMKLNKLFVFITLFLLLTLVTVFGCQNQSLNIKGSKSITEASGTQKTSAGTSDTSANNGGNSGNVNNSQNNNQESTEQQPGYLDEYEGLHITGEPIDVDIKTYRLEIAGAVDKTLSLTFDEVKNLPAVRIYSELDCPGFFIDKGYWTGVKILDLLDMAGLKENAKRVEFSAIDESYSQILALEEIQPEGFLIAYEFNDKEFSKYHGFPLRVVAKGLPGSIWVKWLGKIEVLTK